MLLPRSLLLTAGTVGLGTHYVTRTLPIMTLQGLVAVMCACQAIDLPGLAQIRMVEWQGLLWNRVLALKGRRPRSCLEPDSLRFRCWPWLIDWNNHMNNAQVCRLRSVSHHLAGPRTFLKAARLLSAVWCGVHDLRAVHASPELREA